MDEEIKEGTEQASPETTSNEPEAVVEEVIDGGSEVVEEGGDADLVSGDTN